MDSDAYVKGAEKVKARYYPKAPPELAWQGLIDAITQDQ